MSKRCKFKQNLVVGAPVGGVGVKLEIYSKGLGTSSVHVDH